MYVVTMRAYRVLVLVGSLVGCSSSTSPSTCEHDASECSINHWGTPSSMRAGSLTVVELLKDAVVMMGKAKDAVMASHSLESPTDINTRVVSPKPPAIVTDDKSLDVIYIDSNSLSRKNKEIQHSGRVSLNYYDRDGVGYIALRGLATMTNASEAKRVWWEEGWKPFYPQGANTSFYSVIRFEPDFLEISSIGRFGIDGGRTDWLPASLKRVGGDWIVSVPSVPAPTPAPGPPGPVGEVCSVCQHIYNATKDGDGVVFENLPETWKCPVCGALKSAFKKRSVLPSGDEEWWHV